MTLSEKIKYALKIWRLQGGDLLASPRTEIAHIEFTSACNLRCVFCPVSRPGYKAESLEPAAVDNIIDTLKVRAPKVVGVNGHGETTQYKNWHLYCDKMLESGMLLHIISNFSREFSQDELDTLAGFKSIEISCDSCKPELFKQMRRGANLEKLKLNLSRLRDTVAAQNRRSPEISFSCVVSDQNVMELPEYVKFGKDLGVIHFNFCNLTEYPELEKGLNPKHISKMPPELLPKAEESINETFAYLTETGTRFHFQQGLMDVLQEKIAQLNSTSVEARQESGSAAVQEPENEAPAPQEPDSAAARERQNEAPAEQEPVCEPAREPQNEEPPLPAAARRQYSSKRPASQTRDCLDPWSFVLVQSNKNVQPCCWHKPIHILSPYAALADAFNSSGIRELRRQLLTGELCDDCLNCPSRGWIEREELKKKVWNYLKPGLHRFWFKKLPEIKKDVLKGYNVTYQAGWYERETNKDFRDPERQSWRWTSSRALCEMENRRKNTLLTIRGIVSKSRFPDQEISLKINDTVIDKFVPTEDDFFREYTIPAELMGRQATFPLSIETNRSFVPSQVDPGSDDGRELGFQVYDLFFGERNRGR